MDIRIRDKKIEIDNDRYLKTNDNNWYKLCRNKIGWKQQTIDDYLNKNYEQIKFDI